MKKMFLMLLIICARLNAQNELELLTTIHGEKEGDAFSSVDAIGDVNGDGYDDFIVGGNSSGEYVKLYFGGSPFDTLNCIKFLQGTRKRVYTSGCGKGDLNGDGYNDFIINTMYDVNDYRVEIYYGGKDKKIYDNPDLTIVNNGWYYNFGGRSIRGDLNGDGYDDLVISAPADDYDARGRVYIYYGDKEMDADVDVYLEGKEPFDLFGCSVSIIGDANGDGYDDLLVGAPQDLKGKGGKAYLFFGGDNIGFNHSVEFVGDTTMPYNSYGRVVSGLGDINGDGFDDFGILSIDYIDIFSGKTLEVMVRHKYNDETKDFWYIGGIGDINQDGFNDYAIVDNKINFYFGKEMSDTTSNLHLEYWGYPVVCLGDINGDKKYDLAVGRSYGENPAGIVNIYSYEKLSSVEENNDLKLPNDYKLYQNYPNPFNPTTKIQYNVYKELEITIDVMDLAGEKIKTLFSGQQIPGIHSIIWSGTDANNSHVASGIYFLRFTTKPITGNYSKRQETIKMVLMK